MTRAELPIAPRSSPAEVAGNGSRRQEPAGRFEDADAGFLQQLAMIAADEDAAAGTPRSKAGPGEAVIAQWPQKCAGAGNVSGSTAGRDQLAKLASMILAGDHAKAKMHAVLLTDRPAGDASDPQGTDQPAADAKDAGLDIGADILPTAAVPPVDAAATAMPAAASPPTLPAPPVDRQLPVPAEPIRPMAKDATAEPTPHVVTVVRSETHFAPVLPTAQQPLAGKSPLFQRAGADDGRTLDAPADGTRTPRTGSAPPRVSVPDQPITSGPFRSSRQDADNEQTGSDKEAAVSAGPLAMRGLGQPATPVSGPVAQIADAIAKDLPASNAENVRTAPAATAGQAAQQPAKVLTIQLHPVELGTVTIRMALKADALDLHVEATRRSTARLIDADRDMLTSLLRSAGYDVETLTVRAVDPASAPASPSLSQGSPDLGGQLQPGANQPDSRSWGGRAHHDHRGKSEADRNSNDGEQNPAGRPGAGLYV